jgi:hypothetical protein
MKMKVHNRVLRLIIASALVIVGLPIVDKANAAEHEVVKLTNEEVKNIVQRSYQYVGMYNVNNKFAISQGGWNTVAPDTKLKDHTLREIARPNNDTLYIGGMLDLRKDPVILDVRIP